MKNTVDAYSVIIFYKNRPNTLTWCENYRFDPGKRTLTLYGCNKHICGSINLDDLELEHVDIYDVHRLPNILVETFLPRLAVI